MSAELYTQLYDRPLVYVAGPYTRPDPVVNTRLAIEAADDLMATGLVTCFVPHLTMLFHLVRPHDLEFWYEYDLTMLARSDALLRLPGESTGADREVEFAVSRGIPVCADRESVLATALATLR